MPVKMKIKVTKEVLFASKMCSLMIDKKDGKVKSSVHVNPNDLSLEEKQQLEVIKHCAIAVAVRELFPFGAIGAQVIMPFYYDITKGSNPQNDIRLPLNAIQFIRDFDRLGNVEERLAMPEFEFHIHIPDHVIEMIEIPDLSEYLKGSKTLELV